MTYYTECTRPRELSDHWKSKHRYPSHNPRPSRSGISTSVEAAPVAVPPGALHTLRRVLDP